MHEIERVQHYASVYAKKHLEPGVAGDTFVVWTELKNTKNTLYMS